MKFSSLLLLNKKPPNPSCSISVGPFGQLLDKIGIFKYDASNKTNPGSSHNEDKTKHSAFFKYL